MVGIEEVLDFFHQGQGLRSDLPGEVGGFGQTYPMFTGQGASQLDDGLEQLFDRLVRFFLLTGNFFVKHNVHMDVPVAGMPETDHHQTQSPADFLEPSNGFGNSGPGNHDIFIDLVGTYPKKRRGDGTPGLPEFLRLLGGGGGPDAYGPQLFAGLDHSSDLTIPPGPGPRPPR